MYSKLIHVETHLMRDRPLHFNRLDNLLFLLEIIILLPRTIFIDEKHANTAGAENGQY